MNANIVEIALGSEPGLTLKAPRLFLECLRQFVEDVASAEIVDAVDGVQPKRVDVIFGEPVQRVVDDESAHAIALRTVKVDGLSPGRVVVRR